MKKQTIQTYDYHELTNESKNRAFVGAWKYTAKQRTKDINKLVFDTIRKVFASQGFNESIGVNHLGDPYMRLEFLVNDEARRSWFKETKQHTFRSTYWTQLKEDLLKTPNGTNIQFSVTLGDIWVVDNAYRVYAQGYMDEEWFDIEDTFPEAIRIFEEILGSILQHLRTSIISESYFRFVCEKNSVRFTKDGWPLKNLEKVELPTYEEFEAWGEANEKEG